MARGSWGTDRSIRGADRRPGSRQGPDTCLAKFAGVRARTRLEDRELGHRLLQLIGSPCASSLDPHRRPGHAPAFRRIGSNASSPVSIPWFSARTARIDPRHPSTSSATSANGTVLNRTEQLFHFLHPTSLSALPSRSTSSMPTTSTRISTCTGAACSPPSSSTPKAADAA